jgi:hypothetical protein
MQLRSKDFIKIADFGYQDLTSVDLDCNGFIPPWTRIRHSVLLRSAVSNDEDYLCFFIKKVAGFCRQISEILPFLRPFKKN